MWFINLCILFLTTISDGTARSLPENDASRDPLALPKPTLNPPLTNLDEYLTQILFTVPHQVVRWTGSKINFVCKDRFQYEGYDVEDISMFHVQYEDCYQPWVMCRHTNASQTAEGLADAIGRIPAAMRQYIRHVVALPPARTETEEQSYNDFDTIVLKGAVSLHGIFAEAAVSMGRYTSLTGRNYWENIEWLEAHGNDTAVLNAPSQTSQQTNFAQHVVVALADFQKPGFGEGLIPEFKRIRNQVQQVQKDLGRHFENMLDGKLKQCPRRIVQHSVVGTTEELPVNLSKSAHSSINVA